MVSRNASIIHDIKSELGRKNVHGAGRSFDLEWFQCIRAKLRISQLFSFLLCSSWNVIMHSDTQVYLKTLLSWLILYIINSIYKFIYRAWSMNIEHYFDINDKYYMRIMMIIPMTVNAHGIFTYFIIMLTIRLLLLTHTHKTIMNTRADTSNHANRVMSD